MRTEGTDRYDVAIIGAGVTGVSCARRLARDGLRVIVLDKGRGIGGRMSTRRTPQGLIFDHGAPYLDPRSAAFAAVLAEAQDRGEVAPWHLPGLTVRVGLPGMADLIRGLADNLPLQQSAQVTGLLHGRDGWQIRLGQAQIASRRLVLTIPPVQAAALLGGDHGFASALGSVVMTPAITLMAGFDPAAPRPFMLREDEGALARVVQDSSKPGRVNDAAAAWVVQSDPEFSAAHIDRGMDELAALLAPMLCSLLGAEPRLLRHAAAHRWLYARASRPLGQPFLAAPTQGLWVGGDWCLGPDAEDGWISGDSMAGDLLARA